MNDEYYCEVAKQLAPLHSKRNYFAEYMENWINHNNEKIQYIYSIVKLDMSYDEFAVFLFLSTTK